MTTYSAKTGEVSRDWYVVDMAGKNLGRAASEIAKILRGKHKPVFTPHSDTGDFVIVVNAEKLAVTGRKLSQKMYYRHTKYLGGLKTKNLEQMLVHDATEVVKAAVWGMLPHGPLGRRQIKKLKVFTGPDHPHQAQTPKALELKI